MGRASGVVRGAVLSDPGLGEFLFLLDSSPVACAGALSACACAASSQHQCRAMVGAVDAPGGARDLPWIGADSLGRCRASGAYPLSYAISDADGGHHALRVRGGGDQG